MQPTSYERLLIAYARHFPIRRGKMRIIDALWRSAIDGRGTQRIAKLRYAGFKMPCDLCEMLQRQFYFFGTYFLEEENLECWCRMAADAKVVFDVGANAGIYSLAALAVQPNATVHAFEPTPEIAARLREIACLNGLTNLHVNELAIHSTNGRATLHRVRDRGNDGMNFVRTDSFDENLEFVETKTLDRVCVDHKLDRIDLLKIDVQGHESSVLVGAKELLQTGRIGTVFIELNWGDDHMSASPANECICLLDDAGYEFSRPRLPLQWQSAGTWLSGLNDLVARKIGEQKSGRLVE